jgi:hypothetical protein
MKTILLSLLAGLGCFAQTLAQNPEWMVYDHSNSGLTDDDIRCLDVDNNGVKWIGSINNAVFTYDGSTWNHYNSTNSYIYDNYILCISTDAQNNKWIGSRSGGMCMFDGTSWHLYDMEHSGIPSDKISDIQFEGSNIWVATQHGLAKFDLTNWTVYNTSNSGIPAEEIRGVAIDNDGNKWVATWGGGLGKFDGTNWTSYNTSNSVLPTNSCISIYFDGTYIWAGTSLGGLVKLNGSNMEVFTTQNSGILSNSVFDTKIEGQKLWFATAGGLSLLEGETWTAFTPGNSGIPSIYTRDIEIDAFGNKWIATDKGVAIYKTGGIVGKEELAIATNEFTLFQAYPNPAKENTLLSWNMPEPGIVTIRLYEHSGKEVIRLPGKTYGSGYHAELVNTSVLKAGFYVFQIKTPDGIKSAKLVVW